MSRTLLSIFCWRKGSGLRISLLVLLCLAARLAQGAQLLYLSEILFNPPGADTPNEYVEFRGTPNATILPGTYLVVLQGNAGSNPGTIQNVFDLSGLVLGGNGYLVLCQEDAAYLPNPRATTAFYSGPGTGWGSRRGWRHTGNNDITELGNASATFLLVETPRPPFAGEDLDSNDDGVLDSAAYSLWNVLDSIGVLDADGAGDIAYGQFNFRRNSAPGNSALATGRVFGLPFTPRYVARNGNSTGRTEADWVAAEGLDGTAPDWTLSPVGGVWPAGLAGARLDNIGAPNFGARNLPGLVTVQSDDSTQLPSNTSEDTYSLGLNTKPAGPVTVVASCGPQIQIAAAADGAFTNGVTFVFTNDVPITIRVQKAASTVADFALASILHKITASADTAAYPLSTLPAEVLVKLHHPLLLNEIDVNPPGVDGGHEFLEFRGTAGEVMTNVWAIQLQGRGDANPGTVWYARSLTGLSPGANGLIAILSTNSAYSPDPATTVVEDPRLGRPEGAFENASGSFLLIGTSTSFAEGEDLDPSNTGFLRLPGDATILDAVAWTGGDKQNIAYGGAELKFGTRAPDALCRWPGNDVTISVDSWFFGDLIGPGGNSIAFEANSVSSPFPDGTLLSPAAPNALAPQIVAVQPHAISGVVGDVNPRVSVRADPGTSSAVLHVVGLSSNSAVLPDANISFQQVSSNEWTVSLQPVSAGYSDVTLWIASGAMSNKFVLSYAASLPGRPGGTWHIGASDGSTAVPISPELMLVGDDENQVIRLYPRNSSSLAVGEFDFTDDLGLPDASAGVPREVDIESSTRSGDVVFWMGSLGHSVTGENRTNRTRVFATKLIQTGAAPVLQFLGRYDYLKQDLIVWDKLNYHGKGANYYGLEASDADGVPPKAPDGSGFAIEGLTMLPGQTETALIGFRAPIVPATNRTFALIVPILNFTSLATSGGPPGSARFGQPIELDLYGRGIRSLELIPGGILIIGGPAGSGTGPYPEDFRLYTWTGLASDPPRQRGADLSGLNPEGIVEFRGTQPWNSADQVNLLSDSGSSVYYGDGIPAKALKTRNFKKCRSDWVSLGDHVLPVPKVTSFEVRDSQVVIRWRALQGLRYRVESRFELANDPWVDVSGALTALSPYMEHLLPSGGARRFFRIVAFL